MPYQAVRAYQLVGVTFPVLAVIPAPEFRLLDNLEWQISTVHYSPFFRFFLLKGAHIQTLVRQAQPRQMRR